MFALKILAEPGARYGRLVVIKEIEHPHYECRCDCGKITTRNIHYLRRKRATISCGCFQSDSKKTHGFARKSRAYSSWANMKNRCNNPRCDRYADYGGRGITVCERWNNSFENFLSDMGECPPGMQIDRIDNNDGYKPGNCKWSTRKEQSANRRSNRLLSLNGETRRITVWAALLGLGQNTIRDRLKRGLPIERVLTSAGRKPSRREQTPKRPRKAREAV